jgi:hypothetical protein
MNPLPITPLTRNQIHFAIQCTSKWIRICEENGRGSSWVDADHSALLFRLLSGKKEFPTPPPLFHSYPAYLLEEGEKQLVVSISNNPVFGLMINQGKGWLPESPLDDQNCGIVIFEATGAKYKLFKSDIKVNVLNKDRVKEEQIHNELFIQKMDQLCNT